MFDWWYDYGFIGRLLISLGLIFIAGFLSGTVGRIFIGLAVLGIVLLMATLWTGLTGLFHGSKDKYNF